MPSKTSSKTTSKSDPTKPRAFFSSSTAEPQYFEIRLICAAPGEGHTPADSLVDYLRINEASRDPFGYDYGAPPPPAPKLQGWAMRERTMTKEEYDTAIAEMK